jgi:diguanylate cyclase (GGDEF)-like protein
MGRDVEDNQLQSVASAFARRARRTVLLLFVFAVTLFAASSYRLLDRHRTERSIDEARLCAKALSKAASTGQAERLVRELSAASPAFVGAAWVDGFGQPEEVVARSPAMREAIFADLRRTPDQAKGYYTRGRLVGVTVGESFSPGASRIIVFVEPAVLVYAWLGAIAVFGLFLIAMTFVTIRSLRRWFDQHVARPLKGLTVLVPDAGNVQDRSPVPPTRWKETVRIASLFQAFIDRLNENDARAYRLEQEAAHRLRECEAGYDRELRRARDRATTDPLTRLRNRAFLDADVPALFRCHKETDQPLAAVMIDIDNFKPYNDMHGHQVGDALLRFVGALLRGSIRPTDHAIRYGGDEFMLMLPGMTVSDAQSIAMRLIRLFMQYTACLEASDGLSLSIGVSALPDPSCADMSQLIARADRAMYEAKALGKNGVAVAEAEPGPSRRPDPRKRRTPALDARTVEAS